MLIGSYNNVIVICSLLVAVLASYTALSMAERMFVAKNPTWWHVGGAVAMGVGIWSMHFIGMLAFSLPIELGYDLNLTLLSLMIAIVVSYFAFRQVAVENISKKNTAVSSVLMGLGIAAMHYTGMEAMQMFPSIQYKMPLLILSIVIAIAASYAALSIIIWIRFQDKVKQSTHVAASIVMGVAIVGMHYTGMLAAEFPANSICGAAKLGVHSDVLALWVGVVSLLLLLVSKLISIFDERTTYFIESLAKANQQLKTQTFYDHLTKLPNRVLLEEQVKQALQRAKNHQYSIAYMVINLDGFKTINASIGLNAGDAVLIEVANRIRAVLEDQHAVARAAADEFVVVLEQIAPEDAAVVAERVMAAIRQPLMLDGKEIAITSSIGIATSSSKGKAYEEISYEAHTAMQRTKQLGKNGYRYYQETMDADTASNLALLSDLRRAIELDQLSLNYQPKLDVKTGRVNGAEALLRWEHSQDGFISPAVFIPLAEESGLIVAIGDWVLDRACRQLKEWRALGYEEFNVAINLSSVQFLQENLFEKIAYALDFYQLPASCLTIEVTESTSMQDVEQSLIVLQKIADLGVKVSIDDFGTGYSSLLYLKRFPAEELKIDRAFVSTIGANPDDELMAKAIISLGHQFGLKLVAEGIETQAQKDLLSHWGCDTLQGYFLGKPVPSDAFLSENAKHMIMSVASVDTSRAA